MNELKISSGLIAPCGMDCGICRAHLREKNPCHGCTYAGQNRPKSREHCRLRICTKRNGRFCFDCAEFPCGRLKHLDKRYRTRYAMSEIENLKYIKEKGIKKFVEKENKKWVSKKGILCVHDKKHYKMNSGNN